MPRSTNGPATKARRNRVLKRAKGFVGGRSTLFRTANETVKRAMYFSYRDRKVKKRDMRGLFIMRINAACRENEISYSRFVCGLKKANISLDRKMLSQICIKDEAAFTQLVELAKKA